MQGEKRCTSYAKAKRILAETFKLS